MVGSGAEVTFSGGLGGASIEGLLEEEEDDGLTYTVEVIVVVTVSSTSSSGAEGFVDDGDGCTVTIIVVVTCVVLWSFAVEGDAGSDVPIVGWFFGDDGAGAMLKLGSVTRVVVGLGLLPILVDGEPAELLAGAAGALGWGPPGQLKSIRGLCVIESIIPQSGWFA